LAIVILVIFSYPLQAHPCRASIDKIMDHFHQKQPLQLQQVQDVVIINPAKRHLLVTTCIVVASYLVAITISQLDLVLSFVGSTGSTTISFILPGLFYLKLFKQDGWDWKRCIALFLIIYGFMVMSVCLTFNIKRLL
jgi:amino acid permease